MVRWGTQRVRKPLRPIGAMLLLGLAASLAHAGTMVTTPELRRAAMTACTGDVLRLCPSTIFDEQKVFACMGVNRTELSPNCRTVYDKGAQTVRR